MRSILLYLTCMLAFALPASAQDYSYSSGDVTPQITADEVNFNGISGAEADVGTLINGLSASMTILLQNFQEVDEATNTWTFLITMTNTSTTMQSNLTSVAFDVTGGDGSIVSATVTHDGGDVYFVSSDIDSHLPNIGSLDLCITGANGNCTGGGGGLYAGDDGGGNWINQSGSFILTIEMAAAVDPLQFMNFGVRYQGITGGIYDGASGIGLVTTIPEPATWLMMIIGFGIVSASARRSKRHTSVTHA